MMQLLQEICLIPPFHYIHLILLSSASLLGANGKYAYRMPECKGKGKATIHAIPGFPNTGDVTICGPDSVLMISTPGANATIDRWYDSITGGTLLIEDNDFLTPYLTATHRYFVSSYNALTHCESSRRDVQAVILPTPGPNPILGPSQVGIGQTNVIYSVNFHSGSTYNWSVPPGVNVLLTKSEFRYC